MENVPVGWHPFEKEYTELEEEEEPEAYEPEKVIYKIILEEEDLID